MIFSTNSKNKANKYLSKNVELFLEKHNLRSEMLITEVSITHICEIYACVFKTVSSAMGESFLQTPEFLCVFVFSLRPIKKNSSWVSIT